MSWIEIDCPLCPNGPRHFARMLASTGSIHCIWTAQLLEREEVVRCIERDAFDWLRTHPLYLDGLAVQHRAAKSLFRRLVEGQPFGAFEARQIVRAVNRESPKPLAPLATEVLLDEAAEELLGSPSA